LIVVAVLGVEDALIGPSSVVVSQVIAAASVGVAIWNVMKRSITKEVIA
jgi:hypothetical protein